MAEEKKESWLAGWRKFTLSIIGMASGIYCLINGRYQEGVGLIGLALGAYTYGNIQEHKIKNGNNNGQTK